MKAYQPHSKMITEINCQLPTANCQLPTASMSNTRQSQAEAFTIF
jgi:hypothetical protein